MDQLVHALKTPIAVFPTKRVRWPRNGATFFRFSLERLYRRKSGGIAAMPDLPAAEE
ncbi:hypothetical protein [Rhodomicrobium udaipurense]|uniref:Uncharacterized protein n=1 Tax=Rhodomicrobium udaipurense TaxID=1202716 RepID=A0A8I1GG28_9HYPH|nr:hypothetical protein [Rhodomicrobium udaipurense]MBJ7544028.1 hypothetical protein [Rhodomicrobium udaipurense]